MSRLKFYKKLSLPENLDENSIYFVKEENEEDVNLYVTDNYGNNAYLDLQLTWNNITGRPSSSPADIDDAVAKRHTHSNLTQLNKISEDANGFLTYNNDYPKTGWDSTN